MHHPYEIRCIDVTIPIINSCVQPSPSRRVMDAVGTAHTVQNPSIHHADGFHALQGHTSRNVTCSEASVLTDAEWVKIFDPCDRTIKGNSEFIKKLIPQKFHVYANLNNHQRRRSEDPAKRELPHPACVTKALRQAGDNF